MSQPNPAWAFDPSTERTLYVRRLLEAYAKIPTGAGRVRPHDRRLAHRLFDQRISLRLVEAALNLAAARRLFRTHQDEPLAPIRSLHYVLPLIEEIRNQPIDPDYLDFIAFKLRNAEHELEQIRKILQPLSQGFGQSRFQAHSWSRGPRGRAVGRASGAAFSQGQRS